MPGKRKRNTRGTGLAGDPKRQRVSAQGSNGTSIAKDAVLVQYYTQVVSLRQYLLTKLPASSKARKKKVLSFGRNKAKATEADDTFSRFLDGTLIGVRAYEDVSQSERVQQWQSFSQRVDGSESTFGNLSGPGIYSQNEIVDFTIWLMFQKVRGLTSRPQHLLCQGFRKDPSFRDVHRNEDLSCTIPGLFPTHTNSHIAAMKGDPWPRVLTVLGKEGDQIMIDLVLDCGVFIPIDSGHGSYHQLSGQPLGDLQPLPEKDSPLTNGLPMNRDSAKTNRSPADISFVRNRMLYARAALNAQGGVRFGLRHIHVLNRFKGLANKSQAVHNSVSENTCRMLMYIFPRQFHLHNVFTSKVDPRETVQPFKDYTLREDEIGLRFPDLSRAKLPKRLRGEAARLVTKLQARHEQCAYKKLLDYYCPVTYNRTLFPSPSTQNTNGSASASFTTHVSIVPRKDYLKPSQGISQSLTNPTMMDYATPTAMVSAFCRAVLSTVIPCEFWGGPDQETNQSIFNKNVDRFINLRRYENLPLHEVLQGIKITRIGWLNPPESKGPKLAQTDINKRAEIFHEFVYYIYDSLLIPLLRANFHITESNVHRYSLFFFRHDVWRTIAEPAIASLKLNMFEEVKLEKARKILDARSLGFSQVRLLPKETGVRPIMNLRRRMVQKGQKTNILGPSINSILAPVYNVLAYEKSLNPNKLGSTLFSVGDLYTKLKTFKASLKDTAQQLYFAKVDVKAAFDTIPQDAVVALVASLPSESTYQISRHVEIKPGDGYSQTSQVKPLRKWAALANAPTNKQTFAETLETSIAIGKKNTIFVENVVSYSRKKDDLVELLAEHVQQNMVKIGKKFYRQKEGIPQGSVLSSILCNYFYADLEAQHLHFLNPKTSLLLRLIDDFLLITTDRSHAKQFLQVMHDGLPAYGVKVNPNKTLVNFESTINKSKVPRLVHQREFPYCGVFIDIQTLDITKDRGRNKGTAISDSLTVEFSKRPGKAFHRKVLSTFKIQAHPMFLDTTHNSLQTVLRNVHNAFIECATKMWTYAQCLPTDKQPSLNLLKKTLTDVAELAFVLMKSKSRSRGALYRCAVTKSQVQWLALNAFRLVLQKRQSKYRSLLYWVDDRLGGMEKVVSEKQIIL